jgi:hypothetical protein
MIEQSNDKGQSRFAGAKVTTEHVLHKVHVSPFCYFGYYHCSSCNDHGIYKDIIKRECPGR